MGSMPGLGRSPRVGNGWQPTPVFLPGKFHRQKSLEGCSPWDHKSWTWLSMCTPHIYRIKKVSMYICFQSLCCVWLFVTPWTATNQASLPFTISRRLLRLMSTELVMPSNHLIFCHPLLLLPSVFPSIRVLSNESALRIRWPNVLELQLHHQSFQWIFRVDFLYDWLVWSCCPRDSQVFSSTTIWKHQFFCTQPSFWSNSHLPTWLLEKL